MQAKNCQCYYSKTISSSVIIISNCLILLFGILHSFSGSNIKRFLFKFSSFLLHRLQFQIFLVLLAKILRYIYGHHA